MTQARHFAQHDFAAQLPDRYLTEVCASEHVRQRGVSCCCANTVGVPAVLLCQIQQPSFTLTPRLCQIPSSMTVTPALITSPKCSTARCADYGYYGDLHGYYGDYGYDMGAMQLATATTAATMATRTTAMAMTLAPCRYSFQPMPSLSSPDMTYVLMSFRLKLRTAFSFAE
jgi:hypothetical protein